MSGLSETDLSAATSPVTGQRPAWLCSYVSALSLAEKSEKLALRLVIAMTGLKSRVGPEFDSPEIDGGVADCKRSGNLPGSAGPGGVRRNR